MKVRWILSLMMGIALLPTANGQPPKMENGEECIDWFLLSWNELDQCHAVAGRAENAPSSGNGYQQIEWFEIKCINGATKEKIHYCEQRQVSFENSSSALGVPWRKSLRSKDKYYISVGPRTKPMEKFDPPVFDSNGKLISGVRFTNDAPNAFGMAMMTGSGIDLSSKYDCTYFTKSLSKMKKIDEDTDSKDRIKVFAFDAVNSRELTFDLNHGMPVYVRGFFRDKTVGGELGRSHFPLLNFESRTEWECLEDGKTYVPAKVDNFVHRTGPQKNASSRHVQLVVAYDFKEVRDDILSEANLASDLKDEGPIAKLREKLLKKVEDRASKKNKE